MTELSAVTLFNLYAEHIMRNAELTAWQMEGEKVEVVTDFFFLGSKITEDHHCSHEIRRPLLLGGNL